MPYLDIAGFALRTVLPSDYVNNVETMAPGFLAARIVALGSWVNARLRKRYVTPFGQVAPGLTASGTAPPSVVVTGTPNVGSYRTVIQITGAGGVGVATFRWSIDGGTTWTSATTATSVPLGATGMVATFPPGTYAADNVYVASTPVPEAILGWMTAILTPDVLRKRGVDHTDPTIAALEADRQRAIDELKEAADSDTGLFDLPLLDSGNTTDVSAGGPYFYAEPDPYCWTDQQAGASYPFGLQNGYGWWAGR